MRLPDWEIRLAQAMREHMRIPFQYGVSDCVILCADAVVAVTGDDPMPKRSRGKYKTKAGAARMLLKHGFNSVTEAWAARFEEIHPAKAQRGDIVIFEIDGVPIGAPVLTQGALVKIEGQANPVHLSPLKAVTAFRVAI